MRFDHGINKKYRKSVEDAFDAIVEHGNDMHRHIANHILKSDMLVRVRPVSEINASGITGLIDRLHTRVDVRRDPRSRLWLQPRRYAGDRWRRKRVLWSGRR